MRILGARIFWRENWTAVIVKKKTKAKQNGKK